MSSRWRSACGRAGLSWRGGQTLIAAQLCTQPRMWALWQLSGFDVYRVALALPPLIPARNYGHVTRTSMFVMWHGELSLLHQYSNDTQAFFFYLKLSLQWVFCNKIMKNYWFYKKNIYDFISGLLPVTVFCFFSPFLLLCHNYMYYVIHRCTVSTEQTGIEDK